MDKLISDILIYSKSERGKLEKSEVDLKELIASIINSLTVPEGFQITVNVDCATLFTEEIFLIQIFTNLLNNSIKHHDKDNGSISIGCSQEQSLHTFFVSDDGPGIPFENQNKIFKIFEGADLSKVDSTGVGLSIVKKIVNDKGGKIWVESDGRGTKFIFTWPNQHILHTL
jgi:signal transduction histidine kinase